MVAEACKYASDRIVRQRVAGACRQCFVGSCAGIAILARQDEEPGLVGEIFGSWRQRDGSLDRTDARGNAAFDRVGEPHHKAGVGRIGDFGRQGTSTSGVTCTDRLARQNTAAVDHLSRPGSSAS